MWQVTSHSPFRKTHTTTSNSLALGNHIQIAHSSIMLLRV